MRQATRKIAAAYIASGVDPVKNVIFNQSQVAEHAELAWVFNCVARMGWLNRMTQFKEKAGKDRENASVGLFVYPSLMAADILLYRATHVPVGDDQKQHIELARDIAQKFNNDFALRLPPTATWRILPLPEPLIQGPAARVMSLRDGLKKMSKSDPSEYSRISLSDDAEAIAQKVRKAKTDAEPLPSAVEGLAGRSEAENLVGIYAALSDSSREKILRSAGRSFPRSRTPWLIWRSPSLGRSARKCAVWKAIPPISIRFCAMVRNGRAKSPDRSWIR